MNSCPSGRCALSDRTPGRTNIPFGDLGGGSRGLDSGGLGGAFAGTPYRVGDDVVCTGVSTGAADPAFAVTRSSADIRLILQRYEDSLPDLGTLMKSFSSIYTGGGRVGGGTEAEVEPEVGAGSNVRSSGSGGSGGTFILFVRDFLLRGLLIVVHILMAIIEVEVEIEMNGSPDERMVRCGLMILVVM